VDFAENQDIRRAHATKSVCTCLRNAAGKDLEPSICDYAEPTIANVPMDLLLKRASTAITGAALPPHLCQKIPTNSPRSPADTTEPEWSNSSTTLAEPNLTNLCKSSPIFLFYFGLLSTQLDMCSRISWCIGRTFFTEEFQAYISAHSNDISEEERVYMRLRYLRTLAKLDESTKRCGFWYTCLGSVVTVGSLIVPALISVQDRPVHSDADTEDKAQHENNVYWTVWGISLAVTAANAIIKMLQLDKTYITRNIRLNQLKSEGTHYLACSGVYRHCATRQERFILFTENVERIKAEQTLEEFTHQRSGNELAAAPLIMSANPQPHVITSQVTVEPNGASRVNQDPDTETETLDPITTSQPDSATLSTEVTSV